MKEKSFTLAKERSRRYPARTITDADFADEITPLANTLVQAQSLLLSLKRAAGGIGLHVNADITEFVCFNQRGNISILNSRSLRLVDIFTYLRLIGEHVHLVDIFTYHSLPGMISTRN